MHLSKHPPLITSHISDPTGEIRVGPPGPSPHSKALNLITAAKSLLPREVTDSQVQGLGRKHLWKVIARPATGALR